MSDTEWFAEWFDSPYYHILYRHRDDMEARHFLDRLTASVPLMKGKRVLDIACGQGRHSLYLSELGFDVTGFDLSPANISNLSSSESASLHFFVHDMRNYFRVNYFDYVLNLFSSFGYFERDEDDRKVLRAAAANLKADGIMVFDYANGLLLLKQQGIREQKEIDGIRFETVKSIDGKHLVKEIRIHDHGKESYFQERLRLFTPEELNTLFEESGFRIVTKYGDYDLSAFDPEKIAALDRCSCEEIMRSFGMTLLQLSTLFLSILLSGSSLFFLGRITRQTLKLILAFSGAYLFSLSLIHLLPEVYTSGGASIGVFILTGFFLQIVLEIFSEGIEHGHMHVHHDSGGRFPLAVMLGLCIHSFLEGMPLAQHFQEESTRSSLLAGIILHHIPVAIALMTMLMDSGISKLKSLGWLTVFALMAPLGSWTGEWINLSFTQDLTILFNRLMAIVIGIFLHISTTILFESYEEHRYNIYKLLTILTGAGLALLT